MGMEISVSSFVVFCFVLVAAVIGISNVMSSAGDTNILNNYTVNLTENPNDGDTLLIDSFVFEFDNNSAVISPHIPVLIDPDVNKTTNNLRYAIHDNTAVIVL